METVATVLVSELPAKEEMAFIRDITVATETHSREGNTFFLITNRSTVAGCRLRAEHHIRILRPKVMALLARPDKASKVSRFWNWYHHNVGRAAILLAIGNIFLGLSTAQEVSAYTVSYSVFVAVWVIGVAVFERVVF